MPSPANHPFGLASTARDVSGTTSNVHQLLDPYRPLATQVKKPLLPYLPSPTQAPDLPTLLSLDIQTFSSRLSGKNVLLTPGPSSAPSSLVTGRKRHRGDEAARRRARFEAEERESKREELGLVGLRKVRKRLGRESVGRGTRISYEALLPLHLLHTHYLLQLLSLPPLPSPQPSPLPLLPAGVSPESIQAKLVKADFTGIILTITASRQPSLIGKSGIVIDETASTFRLVTKEDKVKVIPKDGTMFRISFPAYSIAASVPRDDGEVPDPPDVAGHIASTPQIEISLLGSAFGFRSGDRAGRKLKPAQGGGGGSGWGEDWVNGEWANILHSLDDKAVLPTQGDFKAERRRKRGKSRRKDPPAGGTLQVY